MKRPVVALDIDDTLNVTLPDTYDPADWLVIPYLHIPASSQPKLPFIFGGGHVDLTLPIHVRRTVLDWIVGLHDRGISVVWASTWADAAAEVFAPAVGLPRFPVLTTPSQTRVKMSMNSIDWKASALANLVTPDAPLAWIDNDATQYATPDRSSFDPNHPHYDGLSPADRLRYANEDYQDALIGRKLHWRRHHDLQMVIAPDPQVGISDADMSRVDQWLSRIV